MMTTRKRAIRLYVDKGCPEHWIVLDDEGQFWVVPSEENAWDKREPIDLSDDADLEPVPGHYLYLLGLPD